MSGEESATAGALAVDAGQRLGVGDGVSPTAAILRRHDHAEQVVLLRQRNEVMVEAMLDVAQLFVFAQLMAEGIDIGEQSALFGGLHHAVSGSSAFRGVPRTGSSATSGF